MPYQKISDKLRRETGEYISKAAIHRHFTKHVYPFIEEYRKVDAATMATVQKKINAGLDILEEINTKLGIMEDTLTGIIDDPNYVKNPKMIHELRGIINDILRWFKEYQKIRKEFYPETKIDIDKMILDLKEACAFLPVEYRKQIAKTLQEKGY